VEPIIKHQTTIEKATADHSVRSEIILHLLVDS
jgi:hypothetical protein